MVGYRQPPASTAPKVNRNCTARWLPQSPAVTAPSRRELWGAYFSTLDLWELEVPAVNPSVKNQRFLPAPFNKGACLRQVSFHCATPGFFRLSIDSVGTKNPKIPQTQTGAEAKTHHLSQSEGSIPVGSSRGILKGGTIRAGASCSPLKPASLLPFLPEQERKAAGRQCKPI